MALEKDDLVDLFKFNKDGVAFLRIKIQANKGFPKNEFTEILGDGTLKIRIKAIAEKGIANIEIQKFIKRFFGFKSVEIISGSRDSLKMIRIKI